MNTVMDKKQTEKIIQQSETLASADTHPKWQYLRSAVLRSTKDKGNNTMLLVKSRLPIFMSHLLYVYEDPDT